MNTNNLNTALFEKMTAEQDKFRDWLKSQPPEEVLNHAYESVSYTHLFLRKILILPFVHGTAISRVNTLSSVI